MICCLFNWFIYIAFIYFRRERGEDVIIIKARQKYKKTKRTKEQMQKLLKE